MPELQRHRPALAAARPLPIVMLEEPCAFRRAALAALDEAGIPWRIVLVSASLAAVRAVEIQASYFPAQK